MLLLVEICVVVASLSVVAFAVTAVRTMHRVEKATDQASKLTVEIRQWIGQAGELTHEARETLGSVRGVLAPIGRVVDRFETLSERTADLSAAVLAEVEPPLRTAVAVARGMKSVTAYFLERLSHRFTHGRSATNGGSNNE